MKNINLTPEQKQAYDWWSSLSINEAKLFAKKYYPILWEWAYTYNNINYIEPIFKAEQMKEN